MRIAVIPGHGLIGTGSPDPGGQGAGGAESQWTADLADLLTLALRRRGHEAGGVDLGRSSARSALAETVGPHLVLYIHGDVGHGGVFHFPGSAQGAAHAARLAAAVPAELGTGRVLAASAGGYPRANGLLAQVAAPAVLLELVDQRRADTCIWLRQHLADVAELLARALTE